MPYKDKNKQKDYQRQWQCANRKPRSKQGGVITKRRLILEAKSNCCESCGGRFHPAAMHFHHRDPSIKTASISTLERTASVAEIISEIGKCALLCANCHAEVHAGVRETPIRNQLVPEAGFEPALERF